MLLSIRLTLVIWLLRLICWITKPGDFKEREGVIELGKKETTEEHANRIGLKKKPKRKVVKKKKKAVVHKRAGGKLGSRTECGISLYDVEASNATWRGVTCKRCLGSLAHNHYLVKKGKK